MKLVDLEQQIFIPIVDESKGGVEYEMKMTVGEIFARCCQGFEPEVVEAIPVGWLNDRANDPERAPLYRRYAQMLIEDWNKGQEAR